MSASVVVTRTVVILCDGANCSAVETCMVRNVVEFRKELASLGWTWPHSHDRRVDLCPACTATFVEPEGTVKGGRPRKERP